MTANEKAKAKELVSKFENHTSTEFDEADEGNYRAIQCALICVDEIINVIPKTKDWEESTLLLMESIGDNPNDFKCDNPSEELLFWQQVKKEINNL